jgi:hypothetical protein
VNAAREKLLPGARFAKQEHRLVALRGPVERGEERAHRDARAERLAETRASRERHPRRARRPFDREARSAHRHDVARLDIGLAQWSHLHIVNNIFAGGGSNGTTFYVAHVQGPTAPADGLIAGNLFLDGTMGFTLEDASAWTVRDNFFAASIPAMSAGVATSANVTRKPEFLGPANGSTFTGLSLTNASMFQVPTDAEVSDDALCNPRKSPKTAAGVIGP